MTNSTNHIIDQLLVMDAQDGDCRAMEQLVNRWQKRLELRIAELGEAVKNK